MSIVDTACQLPTEMADDWGPHKPRAQWAAHRNAVFDLAWCNVSAAHRHLMLWLGACRHVAGHKAAGCRGAPAVAFCDQQLGTATCCRAGMTSKLQSPGFNVPGAALHHPPLPIGPPPQDDARMLTASGDQTVSLWDTGHADLLASFRGHSGSVKTVCPMPSTHEVFATGARDGALMVWDARVAARQDATTGELFHGPVITVQVRPDCVRCPIRRGSARG